MKVVVVVFSITNSPPPNGPPTKTKRPCYLQSNGRFQKNETPFRKEQRFRQRGSLFEFQSHQAYDGSVVTLHAKTDIPSLPPLLSPLPLSFPPLLSSISFVFTICSFSLNLHGCFVFKSWIMQHSISAFYYLTVFYLTSLSHSILISIPLIVRKPSHYPHRNRNPNPDPHPRLASHVYAEPR